MPSDSAIVDSLKFVHLYESDHLSDACYVGAAGLVVYETLITVDREVKYFWPGRITGAKLLFFANRYITLLAYVVWLSQLASLSDKLHDGSESSHSNVVHPVGSSGSILYSPCIRTEQEQTHINADLPPQFGTVYEQCIDALVILITWTSPLTRGALANIRNAKSQSLSTIVLQNGTMYFVVLLFLNLCHLAFSLDGIFSDGFVSNTTAFTSPLSAILISRFLLELQQSSQRTVKVDSDDELNFSDNEELPPHSRSRVIGSIGSPIEVEEYEVEGIHDVDAADGVYGSTKGGDQP
ncbi:hypothetical protein C8Q74DRAFT_386073 [Fomes fomentarius]|nr:hypothetical protein C8Q74DRAFT_386073 [Fomes fomentarius]